MVWRRGSRGPPAGLAPQDLVEQLFLGDELLAHHEPDQRREELRRPDDGGLRVVAAGREPPDLVEDHRLLGGQLARTDRTLDPLLLLRRLRGVALGGVAFLRRVALGGVAWLRRVALGGVAFLRRVTL